jgi:hypothetical protein
MAARAQTLGVQQVAKTLRVNFHERAFGRGGKNAAAGTWEECQPPLVMAQLA